MKQKKKSEIYKKRIGIMLKQKGKQVKVCVVECEASEDDDDVGRYAGSKIIKKREG